jgi:hypothetical protein
MYWNVLGCPATSVDKKVHHFLYILNLHNQNNVTLVWHSFPPKRFYQLIESFKSYVNNLLFFLCNCMPVQVKHLWPFKWLVT